eukprot:gene14163-biopygen12557
MLSKSLQFLVALIGEPLVVDGPRQQGRSHAECSAHSRPPQEGRSSFIPDKPVVLGGADPSRGTSGDVAGVAMESDPRGGHSPALCCPQIRRPRHSCRDARSPFRCPRKRESTSDQHEPSGARHYRVAGATSAVMVLKTDLTRRRRHRTICPVAGLGPAPAGCGRPEAGSICC